MGTNVVVISGRLTRPAESREVSGYFLSQFTIAFDMGWKDKKHACFVDCKWWGKGAEAISQYLTQGKMVTVTGSWDVDTWQGNDGMKKRKDFIAVSNVELGASPKNEGGADRPQSMEPPDSPFPSNGDIF